jgi:hypothetical protein
LREVYNLSSLRTYFNPAPKALLVNSFRCDINSGLPFPPIHLQRMGVLKYRIALELGEVQILEDIVRKGVSSARTITRARVLLLANERAKSRCEGKASIEKK